MQDGHGQRREAGEVDVWEHDATQIDGWFPGGLAGGKKGKEAHELRREDAAQHGDRRENYGHGPEEAMLELPDFFARLGAPIFGAEMDETGHHLPSPYPTTNHGGRAMRQNL